MLDRLRGGLSYANVMSTVAVCAALGGGAAWAATKIGANDIAKNAVRAKHIKTNQVIPRHLRPGAVQTTKMADGAVTTAKLADLAVGRDQLGSDSVDSAKVADGSLTAVDLAGGQIGAGVASNSNFAGMTPQEAVHSDEITIERAGRLLVLASLTAIVNCNGPDPCGRTYGLFVKPAGSAGDGVQAEGSTVFVPSSGIVTRPVTAIGMTDELEPGTYEVAVLAASFGPLLAGTQESGAILAAVLI
jgi:hypothetical protein